MNYQASLTDTFTKIIILATITTLVPYAFAAGAQLMLMFREPEQFSGRRLAVDATVAILAFLYSFWMIYGAGQEYIAQGFLLLMAGIPVYVFLSGASRRRRRGTTTARRRPPRLERPPALAQAESVTTMSAIDPAAGGRPRGGRRPALRRPLGGRRAAHACSCTGPGLELERLTPRNKDDLLFDDVLWVKRARQEHDAFVDALAERGVEVLEVSHLLARDARQTPTRARGARPHDRRGRCSARTSAPRSASGFELPADRARRTPDRRHRVRRAAVRETASLTGLARRGDFVLAPLPNHLFTRDTSAWVYGGVCVNHMAKPARVREALHLDADLPPPSAVRRRRRSPAGARDTPDDPSLEGGDVLVIGNGCVLVGMGERTRPAGVEHARRAALRGRRGAARDRSRPPERRSAMHLDTVMTMVDRRRVHDLSRRARGLTAYELRPGPRRRRRRARRRRRSRASPPPSKLQQLRIFETGGDRYEAEREQWDDGNNVLALAPGVVVAYERNVDTNTRLRTAASR